MISGRTNEMALTKEVYQTYVDILKEELKPAFGCTEPIALAYCASYARDVLGCLPEKLCIEASGNIIKNVKSVIVPNTGGLKGIQAAAAAGIVAGVTDRVLEVIAGVTEEQKTKIRDYLSDASFEIKPMEDGDKLDIRITASAGAEESVVRIAKSHTNIVYVAKNGVVQKDCGADGAGETDGAGQRTVLKKEDHAAQTEGTGKDGCGGSDGRAGAKDDGSADRSLLTIEDIVTFADEADLADVRELLERQIAYNYAIAEEGIANNWGANVGSVLLKTYGNDVKTRAKAMAAAGSDARMSGCELPVVINSGSGNQGITVSVPVIVYARELDADKDRLMRALLVSNLIAVHIKYGIGPLSAFCGAVSAGCAAGCGIAYLLGGSIKEISHTLVNGLAIVSGIVCDGAKPSCAGKIASSVDAGILSYYMYQEGQQFYAEDGIVSKGAEATIRNIYRLGAKGMCETDDEIIRIMTHCD